MLHRQVPSYSRLYLPERGAAALAGAGGIEAIAAVIRVPFDPAAENARIDRMALARDLQQHIMESLFIRGRGVDGLLDRSPVRQRLLSGATPITVAAASGSPASFWRSGSRCLALAIVVAGLASAAMFPRASQILLTRMQVRVSCSSAKCRVVGHALAAAHDHAEGTWKGNHQQELMGLSPY